MSSILKAETMKLIMNFFSFCKFFFCKEEAIMSNGRTMANNCKSNKYVFSFFLSQFNKCLVVLKKQFCTILLLSFVERSICLAAINQTHICFTITVIYIHVHSHYYSWKIDNDWIFISFFKDHEFQNYRYIKLYLYHCNLPIDYGFIDSSNNSSPQTQDTSAIYALQNCQ